MKKLRIIEALIIIIPILLTPLLIDYVTEIRGYVAYGGEYLLPFLGVLIVCFIETAIDIYRCLKGEECE